MYVQKGGMLFMVQDKKPEELKFIFSNFKGGKEEFEIKNKLIKCYFNHKTLGVSYSPEIMKYF